MSFMIENNTVFLIDTNILVYAYTDSDPQKQSIALQLLEKCWKREVIYAVSLQNLAEFFVVITKKVSRPIPAEHAHKVISDILHYSHWRVIKSSQNTLLQATRKENAHFWDALLAETMLENGITHLYTENMKDFSTLEYVQTKNPFEKGKNVEKYISKR